MAAKVYRTAPQEQESDIMSNSFVKTDARTEAKSFFVLGDKVERRARLTGNWLNIFDVTVEPGGRTPRHAHASPEVFRIIEGTLTIWRLTDTGPEEIEASEGDIVTIAPFMVHGYSNNGTVPAVFSAIVDSDMAEFIETEGVTEQPQDSPSPETVARMRAAANAHGITILAA
jgi:quercetin dioxygenase-like cupin family protein